jgi:hypothetical protein
MDKLELKSSHKVIYTVDVADVESIFYCKPTDPDILTVLMKDGKRLYCDEVCPLQEEPVSEDLEVAAKNHAVERYRATRDMVLAEKYKWSFKAGAMWNKRQLWKDVQGDDLPMEYVKYQLELRLPETLVYNDVKVERKNFIKDFMQAMEDE